MRKKFHLLLESSVLEVKSPGTPDESRVVTDDPSRIGLIASPTRVIIPPGSRRLVRLVNLFPAKNTECIFRVNFTPVAGEFEAEQNSVRLLIGYQALIIVRIGNTVFDLAGQREGIKLTLTNNSYTNVYLSNIRQCIDNKTEECTSLVENRLYPGNVWEVELPGEGPITFNAADGTIPHLQVY